MGQKANPISLRLQLTNRHFDSCWYSDYFYKKLMTRELFVQSYLDHFLKSLKLPGGRHSVQYFQKKTQMSSFFCYPKSTRQSKFTLYGFTKTESFLKKNRFFFKARMDKKMKGNFSNFRNSQQRNKMVPFHSSKRRSPSLFSCFYSTKNQHQLYKIQRKLTSFQNFKLWSTFWSPHILKKGTLYSVTGTFSPCWLNFSCIFSAKKINQSVFNQKNALSLLQLQGVSREIPSINHIEKRQVSLQAPLESLYKRKDVSKNLLKFETGLPGVSPADAVFAKKTAPHGKNAKELTSGVFGKSKTSLDVLPVHFLDRTSKWVEGQFLQNLYLYHILKRNWKEKKTQPFHVAERQKASSIQPFSPLETSCKNYLESHLSRFYGIEMHLTPFRVGNSWQCAHYLADEIVSLLQKRVPFRRLKTKLFKQFSQIPEIRGVRITCSGRVGGKSKKAQRAKTECMKYGQTSLQVLDSKIDFSKKTAFTAFGSVGLKVWVCYN